MKHDPPIHPEEVNKLTHPNPDAPVPADEPAPKRPIVVGEIALFLVAFTGSVLMCLLNIRLEPDFGLWLLTLAALALLNGFWTVSLLIIWKRLSPPKPLPPGVRLAGGDSKASTYVLAIAALIVLAFLFFLGYRMASISALGAAFMFEGTMLLAVICLQIVRQALRR